MTRRPRLVRFLVALYPKGFRDRLGESLAEALHDRFSALRGRPWPRRAASRFGVIVDVVGSAVRERLRPSHPTGGLGPGPRARVLDQLWLDVRFAFRSLRRRPGFTATALATLALGIGANTAVFSVVHGVLLRPLPYPAPEELVMVWAHDTKDPASQEARAWMSLDDLTDVRGQVGIAALEGWQLAGRTFSMGDRPEELIVARVTGGMLGVFGLAPHRGRDLRHEENNRAAPRVVVIGHDFWQQRLGGRPDVVGSVIELSEQTHEVVGVAPEGFDYPDQTELWVPYRHPEEGCGRGCSVYRVVGRMETGTQVGSHSEPLGALASALEEVHPDTNTDKGFHLEPLTDYLVGNVRAGLWVVLGAVGLVLLIVCTNLANLLLARAATRRSEVAVRSALGASRGRLGAQVLTESVVLAVMGALAGIGLSVVLLKAFVMVAPTGVPRLDDVGINGAVLGFAVLSSLSVAIMFGMSPALQLARSSAAPAVTGGARGGNRREGRARSALIAAEIALSLSLVVAASLLTRSLQQLYKVDMGFNAEHVLRFSLSLPGSRYDSLPEFAAFYRQLEERIEGLPGVAAVGSAYGSPFGGGTLGGGVLIEGQPEPSPGQERYGQVRVTTPGYFEAMGLSLVRGRWLDARDGTDSEPVALISETLAAQHFGNSDPMGERVRVTSSFGWSISDYWRVVGIVRDVRRTLRAEPRAAMYVPHSQFGAGFLRVHVRGTSASVAGLMPQIREELEVLDPNLAIANIHTVREAIQTDAETTRFYMLLVGMFAVLAIVVASVGLYGVVAYLTAGRTREFGIRMALGAEQPDISGMVLRQGLAPTAWGIALGVVLSIAAMRWIEALLFNVDPRDPGVLVGVCLLMAVVATSASWLPARRATLTDPTEALRAP